MFQFLLQAAEVAKPATEAAEGQPMWMVIMGLVLAVGASVFGWIQKAKAKKAKGETIEVTEILTAVTKGVEASKPVLKKDGSNHKLVTSSIAKVALDMGVGENLVGFLKKLGLNK